VTRCKADDVIVVREVTASGDSLGDSLQSAFHRAAELAVSNGATSPLELCLIGEWDSGRLRSAGHAYRWRVTGVG